MLVEKQILIGDAAAPAQNGICGVIGGVAVEVTAGAVLALCQRRHFELQVQVIAPTVDREGDVMGQLHVHDAAFPLARCLVRQLADAVVRDAGPIAHLEGAKAREHRLAIHQNVPAVRMLHGLHLDLVAVQEVASNHNLLRRGKTVGVHRSHEAALDLHILALHDPILSVSVEAGPGCIKGNQVRVAPEVACLALGRRWRRQWLHRRRRRAQPNGLDGGTRGRKHTQEGSSCAKHDNREEGDHNTDRKVVALARDGDGQVAATWTHVLVGRLG
mmetsp:Transcript_26272/g.66567  ORF Transcript_26272/g.66567 Transcript_26272/m.66567 type:complete len:273 (+) Transcript_26272:477-1295(+)